MAKELSPTLAAKLDASAKLKKNVEIKAAALKAGVTVEVDGTFEATIFDETQAEDVKATFRFKDNAHTCRVEDGQATIIYSEMLMKIANGEDLSESDTELCPQASAVSQLVARRTLQRFVDLDVSFVERIA